jgi:gluconolactonase
VQTLNLAKLLAFAAIAAVPLTISTMALAQAQAPIQAPAPAPAAAPAPPLPQMPPSLVPSLSVDLMTAPGSAACGAQWRTMEAKIVERAPLPGHLPGYDKGYDVSPHAGEAGFDDAAWPKIEAKDLAARRGGGYVSFIWYRAKLTIPAKIGDFETAGAKAVLTAYVDDYAEVWINGEMPRRSGYPSPATIQGLNMPNRVVLADSVKAGDQFQVAVFGINGPISVAPANTVWFRQASIEFYK